MWAVAGLCILSAILRRRSAIPRAVPGTRHRKRNKTDMVRAYRGNMGDKETNDNLEIELNVMKEQKCHEAGVGSSRENISFRWVPEPPEQGWLSWDTDTGTDGKDKRKSTSG